MEKLKIGDLTLGEGMPKICIPLIGRSQEEILKEAEQADELPCEMVEWRADYILEELEAEPLPKKAEKLKQILRYLKMTLDIPIIFTIRTAKEGGKAKLTKNEYFSLNKQIAAAQIADIIDIEAFDAPKQVDEKQIRGMIDFAHRHETLVLLSNHDFQKTPELVELLTRFFVMQDLGADLMKLAVMPQTESDVFALLEVASLLRDTYANIPFIAISMGELGATTRICGGEFGSSVTFAAGTGASAPGQIDAETLHNYLEQYY